MYASSPPDPCRKLRAVSPLSELGLGRRAVVRRVANERAIALRLLELGLLPGTEVTVLRRAPMGDPIEIRLRDYSLSIRASDAHEVLVESLEAGP